MWALYDAPLASGCQFQWHWAWRVGGLRCFHKMSFSTSRARTYSRLQSSRKLAKRKLGLGLPATFRAESQLGTKHKAANMDAGAICLKETGNVCDARSAS